MIKRISNLIVLTFLVLSCDVIEGPVLTIPDVPENNRGILVVEFTGHKCGNCPTAAVTASLLKETYGDNLIIISPHVGTLAFPSPPGAGKYTIDFRTPTGDAIDQEFGASISGIPVGLVNYLEQNGSSLIKADAWPALVDDLISQGSLPYEVNADASRVGNLIKLTASVEFIDDPAFAESVVGKFNLGAFLTEDSILSWQKNYTLDPQDRENYVQEHVLRGNFYSPGNSQVLPWGLPLTTEEYFQGESEEMDLEINVLSEYRINHLNIIVFLYDRDSKTILQSKEFKLAQ